MARSFNGSSDRAERTSASPITAYPFSLSAWVRTSNSTASLRDPFSLGNSSTADRYALFQLSTGHLPVYAVFGNTTGASITGGATINDGAWHHLLAVSRSATDHQLYVDGSSAGTSSTNIGTAPTLNVVSVGRLNYAGSGIQYFPGDVAECAVWSADVSGNVLSLARAASPLLVQFGSLAAYWRLLGRDSPEPDLRGGYDLTLTGTSQAEHPRVYYPGRRRTVFVPSAGGNTAYTASLSGSLTPSGAVAKAVAQPRTGTLTNAGSLTRASAKTRTGSLTTSGAVTKASAKPLAGTATTGGALTKATSQSRTGSVTLSGLLTRAAAKGLTGTLSLTGSVTKAITKALAGSVTPSGSFVAGSLFTKALTGAVTLTGAGVVKATAKTVTGTITASGSVLRAIAKALTGLLSLTGVFSKSGGSSPADLPPGGVIRRADTRRVIRPVAPPGRVVRRADVRRNFPNS